LKEEPEYQRSDIDIKLDFFLKNTLDLVYIHDLEGRFLDANDLTLETLGYKRKEIKTIKLSNLMDGESLKKLFSNFEGLIGTGKQSERCEYKLLTKEGNTICLSTYSIPLIKNEKIYAILEVARDVTEQRLAEESIKGSKEKYKLILETVGDLVLILNSRFKIEYINESAHKEITGYSKDELINEDALNFIHPDDLGIVTEKFKEIYNKGHLMYKTRYRIKEGTYIWIESNVKLFKDNAGDDKILVLSRDITEFVKQQKAQKILFDKITQSSQFKTEFIAAMSHELRTQLNVIIGFTELLIEKPFDDYNKTQLEYLKDIKSSSQHLLSIVKEILDLSQIETGELELNLTTFKVKDIIHNINFIFKPLSSKKNLDFQVNIDENIDEIRADKVRLSQILFNLLDNAIKFTPEGSVCLTIQQNDKFFLFTITDSGIGIAKEDHKLLFEGFKQIQMNRVLTGSGLGLPLSKRLVNLHGGRLTFESSPGEGSSFTFTIPKK
jgi:PAS domain S-box-containing protein